MNVGYANMNTFGRDDELYTCPLCGSDIYVSKYGNDFKCMNKECGLHKTNASDLLRKLDELLKIC